MGPILNAKKLRFQLAPDSKWAELGVSRHHGLQNLPGTKCRARQVKKN